MACMDTTKAAFMPLELFQELQHAVEHATPRSDADSRAASQRMDEMREALQQRLGVVAVAVDLVREVRD